MEDREIKENGEYLDIVITHIVLNGTNPTNPRAFGRTLAKSINSKKPGMAYSGEIKRKRGPNGGKLKFSLPIDDKYKGKKIRFFYPKEGVKIFPDRNLIEQILAKKKKLSSLISN